jgi:hypothetical protein
VFTTKEFVLMSKILFLDTAIRAKQAYTGICIAKEPFLRERLGTVDLLVELACFAQKKRVLSIT